MPEMNAGATYCLAHSSSSSLRDRGMHPRCHASRSAGPCGLEPSQQAGRGRSHTEGRGHERDRPRRMAPCQRGIRCEAFHICTRSRR